MSKLGEPHIPDDISLFEQSSPESVRAPARARALSPLVHEESSTSDERTDDDYFVSHKPVKECTSSRSSISSFPASVIHNTLLTDNEEAGFRTSSRSQIFDRAKASPGHEYLSAFRHPSSVRALQLESEYADSDTLSLRNSGRPRRSPKISHFGPRSPGSAHSSPTKRSSRPGTPQQRTYSSSKLKKEFPLVLLHCTLLQPAVAARGPLISDEILEAVLPEEYRKRWRILQDKVVKNKEVKQRGVLIPHPRDDYDLLEERLLEALELERPRIRRGHYFGEEKAGDSDSGFESSSQHGSDGASDVDLDKDPGDTCPDCGHAVSSKVEQERKWEVKVFAANGLMRGGAWSAAWEQMEKVDVEVGVWMPEDAREEVEERLKALQAKEEAEKPIEEPIETKRSRRPRSDTAKLRHDERMREIYGEPEPRSQEEIDGPVDEIRSEGGLPEQAAHAHSTPEQPSTVFPEATKVERLPQVEQATYAVQVPEDFLSYMSRHGKLLWNDQRNLAIVLLSMLVLFFSIQNANLNQGTNQPTPESANKTIISAPMDIPAISQAPAVSYITTTIFAEPSSSPQVVPEAQFKDQDPTDKPAQSTTVSEQNQQRVEPDVTRAAFEPQASATEASDMSIDLALDASPKPLGPVGPIRQKAPHEEAPSTVAPASIEDLPIVEDDMLASSQPSEDVPDAPEADMDVLVVIKTSEDETHNHIEESQECSIKPEEAQDGSSVAIPELMLDGHEEEEDDTHNHIEESHEFSLTLEGAQDDSSVAMPELMFDGQEEDVADEASSEANLDEL